MGRQSCRLSGRRRRRSSAVSIVGNDKSEAKLQFTGGLFVVSCFTQLDFKHLLDI